MTVLSNMSDEIAVEPSSSLMEDRNVAPIVPSEPVTPEATPVVEPATPAEPEVELFDLPDGRKVDAETLSKEWKQNFAPEFTRRSQELAELKKGNVLPTNETKNPYADPNYVPQSYEEIIKVAEERALKTLADKQNAEVEQKQAIENEVANQLTEIKKLDPTLNENALFEHANKYDFKDLRLAHQNMKDMLDVVKKTQATTAQNIAKRNDPVSVSPGATGAKLNPDDFSNARDFLRALKGQ